MLTGMTWDKLKLITELYFHYKSIFEKGIEIS